MTQTPFELTFPPETAAGVRDAYSSANVILEYGTGGSTMLAADSAGTTVIACESDRAWLDRIVAAAAGRPGRVIPVHGNIGPTKEWGHPAQGADARKFPSYAISPWTVARKMDLDPDLVLIDGRFRAACFLASLAFIRTPTKLVFDDYTDRDYYHVVEEHLKPAEFWGRAAVFNVRPGLMSAAALATSLPLFFDAR